MSVTTEYVLSRTQADALRQRLELVLSYVAEIQADIRRAKGFYDQYWMEQGDKALIAASNHLEQLEGMVRNALNGKR